MRCAGSRLISVTISRSREAKGKVAEVTLGTRLGRIGPRPEDFASPLLLGAVLSSIQSKNGENASPSCNEVRVLDER